MRTTIDLPDDVLDTARTIARSRNQSLGQAIADLIRDGLEAPAHEAITVSPVTGLPVFHLGRTTTLADVQSLDDDE